MKQLSDNEINIKRTKVSGYYKRASNGKLVWTSPHYRVLVKHLSSPKPLFKRKSLANYTD